MMPTHLPPAMVPTRSFAAGDGAYAFAASDSSADAVAERTTVTVPLIDCQPCWLKAVFELKLPMPPAVDSEIGMGGRPDIETIRYHAIRRSPCSGSSVQGPCRHRCRCRCRYWYRSRAGSERNARMCRM